MPRATPTPPPRPSFLDQKIWQACAGASVEIPTVGSRVYYFPQGHFHQATSQPRNLSPRVFAKPCVPCRVAALQFLADPLTDEVFAKQILHPIIDHNASAVSPPAVANFPPNDDDDRIVSFAKVLTPSDANNGGGFSVPRSCADLIFPHLNFHEEPPVQNLEVTDVHGTIWTFRHIYRGTPRRHLLTTGWSTFVNSKKLVAGDSVLFMKNSAGRLFVGIRRATRFASGGGGLRNRVVVEESAEEEEEGVKEVFSREGKGKLSVTEVSEAAELAVQNLPFEVVYYPKAGWSEFVVKIEKVDGAMRVPWSQGLRVKMAVETDDSSRITWLQGTVSSVNFNENASWSCSPWRMLQITWDEPEVLQNAEWVSPWQVELVSTIPALHSPFPPMKKFRTADGSWVFTDGVGDPFSMTGFTNSAMGNLNQTLLSYGSSPAGMQGARQEVFSAPYFSNDPIEMSRLCMGNSFRNKTVPRLKTLSTELSVASSQSDELSPDSRSSPHTYDTDLIGNHSCNSKKPGRVVFQLFGEDIQVEQPVENGLHGIDSTGDDDDDDRQCQRALAEKACYL